MKFAGYIRIALAVILFTADIVILICGWNHLFRKETVTCSFDSEQVEADTDYNKYRISFISDCSKVQSIDVYYEGRLTPETLAVQSILYDGSRKYTEIREVVIKSDSHIAIELNTERIVMADGTSKYDLCFEKEDESQTSFIRPEFVSIFKKGESLQFEKSAEEAIVEDIIFRGSNLEVKTRIHGYLISAVRSINDPAEEIGEEVFVFIYRLYVVTNDEVSLLINSSIAEEAIVI